MAQGFFNRNNRRSGGARYTRFDLRALTKDDLELLAQEAQIRREFGEDGVRMFWERAEARDEALVRIPDSGRIREMKKNPPESRPMRCRVCGCTQEDGCPGGCGWFEAGLCTICARAAEAIAVWRESSRKANLAALLRESK